VSAMSTRVRLAAVSKRYHDTIALHELTLEVALEARQLRASVAGELRKPGVDTLEGIRAVDRRLARAQ